MTGDKTLESRAAALLSEYLRHGETRTDLLREMAEVILKLRESFTLKDGRPDYGGRSPGYRAAMAAIYVDAHLPLDAAVRARVQTNLRYHLGNLMRDRVPAADLTDYGIGAVSPKSRRDADRARYLEWIAELKSHTPAPLTARYIAFIRSFADRDLNDLTRAEARAAARMLRKAAEESERLASLIDETHPPRGS